MSLKSAHAFVLRAHPVGEADQILVALTERDGKLRGVTHASRKSRRRFGGALQPLSHVRLTYFEREGRELVRIDECDLLHSYFGLQQDLRAAGYLSYLAELSEEFSREKQEDEAFYRLLRATLEAVEAGLDPVWAARYFELWTLQLHGLLPDLEACARCAAVLGNGALYDPLERGFLCPDCAAAAGGTRTSAAVLAHLGALLRLPPSRATGGASLMPGCEELLQGLLTGFLERPLRSPAVLRQMGVL